MQEQSSRTTPKVAVVMGSKSDWETMKHAVDLLVELEVPHEARIVSAHRTPDLLFEYVAGAAERRCGVTVFQVHAARHCFASRGDDGFAGVFQRLGPAACEDQGGAGIGEGERGGAADSRACAGDDGDGIA